MSLKTRDPRSCLRYWRGVAIVSGVYLAGVLATAAAEDRKRDFEIPAGAAETTLRLFAEQAGTQFVYSTDKVKGVRTNGVKGEYAPREALTRLIAGTELRVVQDEGTGALTVDRNTTTQISQESDLGKKKLQ